MHKIDPKLEKAMNENMDVVIEPDGEPAYCRAQANLVEEYLRLGKVSLSRVKWAQRTIRHFRERTLSNAQTWKTDKDKWLWEAEL
jgi:hypothetical protein